MKRISLLFISIVMVFSLVACGTTKFEPFALDEPIVNEYSELTIEKTKISNAISNKSLPLKLENEADSLWFVAYGNIKNLNSTEIDFINGTKFVLTVDEKYEYELEFSSNDLANVVPLEETNFAAYASIPNEVIETCTAYSLKIGFNDEFESLTSLKDADNKYELTGNLDEYGSAGNVDDFMSYVEYLADYIESSDYTDLDLEIFPDTSTVNIDNNEIEFLKYDGLNDLKVQTILKVFFCESLNHKTLMPSLIIECNSDGTHDSPRIISVETITIKSDNGSLEIGNGDFEKDYDFSSVTNATYTTFDYDLDNNSVAKIKEIISGNNLEYVLNVKISGGEFITMNCAADVELLEGLMEIYDANTAINLK